MKIRHYALLVLLAGCSVDNLARYVAMREINNNPQFFDEVLKRADLKAYTPEEALARGDDTVYQSCETHELKFGYMTMTCFTTLGLTNSNYPERGEVVFLDYWKPRLKMHIFPDKSYYKQIETHKSILLTDRNGKIWKDFRNAWN